MNKKLLLLGIFITLLAPATLFIASSNSNEKDHELENSLNSTSEYIKSLISPTRIMKAEPTQSQTESSGAPVPTAIATSTNIPTLTLEAKNSAFTLEEISKHNRVSDCWIIVNNMVYDVTDFMYQHPAGAGAITPYCGKDAYDAFYGVGHSQNAVDLLDTYYIGQVVTK